MKALITGMTGFAGGHLAEHLFASGDEVAGLSTSGHWPARTPNALVRAVRLYQGDLASDETARALERVARDFAPDCVYHLAAISVPRDCGGEKPTAQAIAANVEGTRRVVDWAAALGVRALVVSTSHVYAAPTSREQRAREDDAPQPKNAYGKTKLLAEQAALEAVRNGADVVIARAFQHTGPRQGPRMMLPEWAAQLASGAELIHVRNRDTWIDVSDVRDVVRAYRLLMTQGQRGEIYNVGSGAPRRTGDILEQLIRIAGRAVTIQEQSPGERFDAIADVTKLEQATGWRPELSLAQTINDVWECHRKAGPPP